jgi:uncharacterized protein
MEIKNNPTGKQFEYKEGGETARMEYRFYRDNIALMHTVVPETMKGKGVATALAAYAFAYAQETGKKVMVYCPFVASYVKKNPELESYLDPIRHGKPN